MTARRTGLMIALAAATMPAMTVAAPLPRPGAFAICGACHSVVQGAPGVVGPNLWGIAGRKAAATSFNYSPAMQKSGLTWDRETLLSYVTAPRTVVPGNKMPFAGVSDPKAAAAITDYLMSLK